MATVYEMQNAPTAAEYVGALTALGTRVTDEHRLLFRVHHHAPNRAATAKQIAEWAGVASWGVVNLRYAKLGRAVCEQLGIEPQLRPDNTYQWWSVWSRGWNTPGGFVWQMLPQVAAAFEQLGWVGPSAGFIFPDEVAGASPLVEGAVCRVTVNAYERNPEARRRCIAAHHPRCYACGFDFGAAYGPEFAGFIHIHHLRPLSEIGREYVVDPVVDLRPVCPNCHAVIHHGGRLRSIDEVRQLRAQQRHAEPDAAPDRGRKAGPGC
ncbi:MAG: HNH endonuclease [Pirellulaceae bacterium]